MEDFYFVYGYDAKKNIVKRLYRRIKCVFEKYNFDIHKWEPAPEQGCIYVGKDWDYDEISEEQANNIIKNML